MVSNRAKLFLPQSHMASNYAKTISGTNNFKKSQFYSHAYVNTRESWTHENQRDAFQWDDFNARKTN